MTLTIALTSLTLTSLVFGAENARKKEDALSRESIIAVMNKVNDYTFAHPYKKDDRNWIRATYYTGVMALYETTGNSKILDQAMGWAEKHNWAEGTEPHPANCMTCGQTYLQLYFLKNDPKMLAKMQAYVDRRIDKAEPPRKTWYYCDSLYVGPPTLAMLGKATGQQKYYDYLNKVYWDITDYLLDKRYGLFYRDKNFFEAKNKNGRKIFWSRGNGWVIAGIPRVLRYLPKDNPYYERYVELLRTLAASIAGVQGDDGLWRTNLADADEYPESETSGSAFFCYAIAWGINQGVLEKARYLPVVEKAWKSLVTAVDESGKLGWVQPVSDRPGLACPGSTHEYAVGAFLLAGSQMVKLVHSTDISDHKPSTIIPPAVLAEKHISAACHPLHAKINTFLARQAKFQAFKPTGLTRKDYLWVIDAQIKAMRQYQDQDGRIIDPVDKKEMYYATPCYAHSVATLVTSGRSTDAELLESGMRAMDIAVLDMYHGMAPAKTLLNTGDFYTYPVMLAYELFGKVAPPQRIVGWREMLAQVDPHKLYLSRPEGNNWNVVKLSGEYFRAVQSLTTMDYAEMCLAVQLKKFTSLGMYDERGHPLPYDHFARHYLAGILHKGYRGQFYPACRDLIWKGAWMSLFMQSPFGELPTGYRSSHHIWNEAESAVTYEIYAAHYARTGRSAEAGAMKRAARLSLASIKQWIRPDGSGYIVKNRYPLESRHGYENYSAHTCYNMLTCSMLSAAWQFSDDSVEERPSPADIGGFVVPILQPFHKIFANAGGTYVEYDTSGDHIYNPSGLIRVHIKGGHPQLGPSDGCAAKFSGRGVNLCIGPAWQDTTGAWDRLAEISSSAPKVEILDETLAKTRFRVIYEIKPRKDRATLALRLTETITVEPNGVTVEDELSGGDIQAMRVYYPMLVFDGLEKTKVQMEGNTVALKLGSRGVRFTILEPRNAILQRTGKTLVHRNGLVEAAFAEFNGRRAVYRISKRNP